MKKLQILFMTLATLSQTYASVGGVIDGGGTGDLSTYLSCKGQDSKRNALAFEIRGTAVPTYKQGLLSYERSRNKEDSFVSMKCNETDEAIAENAPSAGKIIWACLELRPSGVSQKHLMQVEVELNSQGMTTAQVSVDGKFTGSLNCKNK